MTSVRTCDFCDTAVAILYCSADTAKLCLTCDRNVHSTNPLFKKHTRSLLCDACDNSPSTILCASHSLSLCQNCDFEESSQRHSLHDRRPIRGFVGCPSVDEIGDWLGIESIDIKDKGGSCDYGEVEGFREGDFEEEDMLLVWDTPSIVTIDDLIVASNRSFQAMGVPPLPKNRNAACGKYKEEILSQLREMAKSELNLNNGHEDIKSVTQFEFPGPQEDLYPADMYTGFGVRTESPKVPPFKGGSFWCPDNVDFANESLSSMLVGSSFEDSCLVPDKDSDINGNSSLVNFSHEGQPIHHIKTESQQILPKFIPRELTSEERDFAISRYKEKKRTRRYDKHIRYESRRIRAENRTRVKGRFAKIDHQGTG